MKISSIALLHSQLNTPLITNSLSSNKNELPSPTTKLSSSSFNASITQPSDSILSNKGNEKNSIENSATLKNDDENRSEKLAAEDSRNKADKPSLLNSTLESLKRQIIKVKEEIAKSKEQLISAKAAAHQGNSSIVDALTNILQQQQSQLSTLMSQYSNVVQKIAETSSAANLKSTNLVDVTA